MSAIASAITSDLDPWSKQGHHDGGSGVGSATKMPLPPPLPPPAAPASKRRWDRGPRGRRGLKRRYGQFPTSGHNSCSDGLLEVVGLIDETQLAKMQVGLSGAVRLAQCSEVRIRIREDIALQVDGEPWMQAPGTIKIKLDGQASMLRKPQEFSENSVAELINILDATSGANIVTPQQRTRIVREILRLNDPSRAFVGGR